MASKSNLSSFDMLKKESFKSCTNILTNSDEEKQFESIPNFDIRNSETRAMETIDITPEKLEGIMKQIFCEGEGSEYPGYGDRVSVHFTGWLLTDPKKPIQFDSSRGEKKCDFNLGKGMVIKGWDIGIATMRKNEVALFIVQPEYAYGEMGCPPKIPPHTPLLFEVELYGWKMEDLSPKKDGSICRKVIKRGEGAICPNDGSQVTIQLAKISENECVEEEEKSFILGEGCKDDILESIEFALLKFHLNETSHLFLKNKNTSKENEVEQDDVIYKVTLLDFKKTKDVWEMNSDEKLEKSKISKQKGVTFIQDKCFKAAVKQFKCIVTCLENEPGVASESEEERNMLLLSAYLNMALCYLKLESYLETIKICDKALDLDPGNEKALFRRGQAKLSTNNAQDALQDFQTLSSIYPDNKAAKNHIILCKDGIKKQTMKDKSIYNEMFDKFKKQDELRMKNMKTETGVWDDDNADDDEEAEMSEVERLLEQSYATLREANVIELSNTALGI